jgi:hypothetical protein
MPLPDLSSRLGTLPLVLAGPILRQVTDSAVTVWLALKKNATVSLNVYDTDQTNAAQSLLSGSLATAPIGRNLHVVAVTARLQNIFNPLTENKLYFYDLHFSSTDPPLTATFSQAISPQGSTVQVKDALTYGGRALPSFVLPPRDLNKLKLIHGSCRKPHAEGFDALAILHNLIDQYASSPLDRPHQLLLTGDQIYADDVADILLLMLNDAGNTLFGWTESLVMSQGESPVHLADWPSYYREAMLRKAQFTSDDLKSHLLSLADYFSMYLFVWSDVLWPSGFLPGFDDVIAWAKTLIKPVSPVLGQKDTIETEFNRVTSFKFTLPLVRRALANIPTYMICDDHEVTDDWNMTRRFCARVYGTALGRRVVQNALVAFSICQAWGNDPDQFATSPATAGSVLLDTLAKVNRALAPDAAYEASSGDIQRIVGIHPADVVLSAGRVFHDENLSTTGTPVSLRFNFRIEGPGHLVLVTDTRTWRAYPDSGQDEPADFLESSAPNSELVRQVSVSLSKPLDDRLMLVVLTTNAPPSVGIRYAAGNPWKVDVASHPGEYVKDLFVTIFGSPSLPNLFKGELTGRARAIYESDLYDSWEIGEASQPQFDRLIAQLDSLLQAQGRTQQVVLLSGDVHSSFASRLTVFVPEGGGGVTPRMVVAQLVGSPLKNQAPKTRGQQLEGYTYAPKEFARFLLDFKPEAFAGPKLSGGAALSAYRLDYLIADPGQTSSKKIPDPLDVKEGDDVANLRNYSKMDSFGSILRYEGATPLQIVGHNNIAELKFTWAPNDRRAHHILHWKGPNGTTYLTTYDVSLNLDGYRLIDVPPS